MLALELVFEFEFEFEFDLCLSIFFICFCFSLFYCGWGIWYGIGYGWIWYGYGKDIFYQQYQYLYQLLSLEFKVVSLVVDGVDYFVYFLQLFSNVFEILFVGMVIYFTCLVLFFKPIKFTSSFHLPLPLPITINQQHPQNLLNILNFSLYKLSVS